MPFPRPREYIYAEHYTSIIRDIIIYFIAAAVGTSAIGYLFLGNFTLTCILSSTVSLFYTASHIHGLGEENYGRQQRNLCCGRVCSSLSTRSVAFLAFWLVWSLALGSRKRYMHVDRR